MKATVFPGKGRHPQPTPITDSPFHKPRIAAILLEADIARRRNDLDLSGNRRIRSQKHLSIVLAPIERSGAGVAAMWGFTKK